LKPFFHLNSRIKEYSKFYREFHKQKKRREIVKEIVNKKKHRIIIIKSFLEILNKKLKFFLSLYTKKQLIQKSNQKETF